MVLRAPERRVMAILNDFYESGATRDDYELVLVALERYYKPSKRGNPGNPHKKRRKLSAWNKYVKANSKKPRFKYRSGKLNLKKMAIAFRKTPAGKKKGKR